MDKYRYEIEPAKPFSKSLIWQLNRKYYQSKGLDAWREGTVPHHLTSNSMVGKTYAELIFAFLRDLAAKGKIQEKVYILELGAGHGRLAFHILKHLEALIGQISLRLPPYCYVLSDIVEDNLEFFDTHPQFQPYFERGILDVAYFDAVRSKGLLLRHSDVSISTNSLKQPLLVIANYFLDSIPNDLFHFRDREISACSVALTTEEDPEGMDEATLLEKINLTFHTTSAPSPFYEEAVFNELLEEYRNSIFNTYIFFPHEGLSCISTLRQLSQKGLVVITMDKGFHEIHDLENEGVPEIITHGSFSIWVNYHAYGRFCKKQGGKVFFPSFSNFYLELACLLFLPNGESYTETQLAYQRFVNDFGPDDFNGFKKFTYKHMAKMSLKELIVMLRMSAYDSTIFMNFLPRLKQLIPRISYAERNRLAQTMHQTWNMYFTLNESFDLAYEIGGILYDLGFFREALEYFQYSINLFGHTADVYYNRALCYYQLREDSLFLKTLMEAKLSFPAFKKFTHLDTLDLEAD